MARKPVKKASKATSKKAAGKKSASPRKWPFKFLQVKPIFYIAPKVAVGSKITLRVQLEKPVPGPGPDTYEITPELLTGAIGEVDVDSKSHDVQQGLDYFDFEVTGKTKGWAVLRVTETTLKGKTYGAVFVT